MAPISAPTFAAAGPRRQATRRPGWPRPLPAAAQLSLAAVVLLPLAAALSAEGSGRSSGTLMRSEGGAEPVRAADEWLAEGPVRMPPPGEGLLPEPLVRRKLAPAAAPPAPPAPEEPAGGGGMLTAGGVERLDRGHTADSDMEEPEAPAPAAAKPQHQHKPGFGVLPESSGEPPEPAEGGHQAAQEPDEGDYNTNKNNQHNAPRVKVAAPAAPLRDPFMDDPNEPSDLRLPTRRIEAASQHVPSTWEPVDISGSQEDKEMNATAVHKAFKELKENRAEELLRVGDGMGSLAYDRSPTSSRLLNHDLRRRLEVQDIAALVLLLFVFAITLLVSSSIIHRLAEDPSPVAFYTDPKYTSTAVHPRVTSDAVEPQVWLSTFNAQPQCARLRIIGRNREHVEWHVLVRGFRFRELAVQMHQWFVASWARRPRRRDSRLPGWDATVFDVSLDLTPFIAGEGRFASEEDAQILEKHLTADNPLEIVKLCKEVEWSCWEDVSTNIKQRLRALGFVGQLEIRFETKEEVLVYRNLAWQNFVRSRLTQVLVVISIVGWMFWAPYLRFRMRTVNVQTRFSINLDLGRYWDHLSEGLHATEGFRSNPAMM